VERLDQRPEMRRKGPERRIDLLETPSASGCFAVRISLITRTRRIRRTQATTYSIHAELALWRR
jgi:hypothetical protein